MTRPDPEVLYVALEGAPERLRQLHRLTYRCASEDRCLLLDAIAVPAPERVLLHQKRFKNSDAVNLQRSNSAGRARNTFDGGRHWRPRTYYIGSSALDLTDAEGAVLDIQCDHVMARLRPSDFQADWTAGHAEVRVRPDGTRYAIR